MSSLIRPLEDVASCGIPYWLPPGGRDNGVWADMWVLIAELESDDASEVLGLLADADVGGYAAFLAGHGPGHEVRSGIASGWTRCNTASPRTY